METSLSSEVLELLEKVRVARKDNKLRDAAAYMIEARALIDAEKRKEVAK